MLVDVSIWGGQVMGVIVNVPLLLADSRVNRNAGEIAFT
jgi:hypothetical protein